MEVERKSLFVAKNKQRVLVRYMSENRPKSKPKSPLHTHNSQKLSLRKRVSLRKGFLILLEYI